MKDNLIRFSELDGYKIHKKDQDVNDWLVRGEDDRILGNVNDLMVDMELMKVVYLEVSLSDHYQKIFGKPLFMLLPVNNVDLDKETEEVLARGVNEKMLEVYPSYEGRIITPAYLFKLQTHFDLIEQGIYKEQIASKYEDYSNLSDEMPNRSSKGHDDEHIFDYDLSELRVKYLELKKELKISQAEREIAMLERDIAFAQMKKEKLEKPNRRYRHNFEHK
jgi:hypothetical protein